MRDRTALTISVRQATAVRRDYLGLFTVESWREFMRHGGTVMGFNLGKLPAVSRLAPGDRILCYLTKVSAFVGVLEVAGPHFTDEQPIWSDGIFPLRVPVKTTLHVPLAFAVPIRTLRGKLSFLPGEADTRGWSVYVRSSPRPWLPRDAMAVESAIRSRARQVHTSGAATSATEALCATPRPNLRIPTAVRVGRVIAKTQRIGKAGPDAWIGSYESVLSFNKVTGYSVNFPIAATCRPTATCMKTCYFAAGAPSWTNAIRHQQKVLATVTADPVAFAERVALEYDRLGLSFIRWNGGGDLFPESVAAVNHLGRIRPDVTIWVVTRIPEYAAQIDDAPRVFVHFSLDRHSKGRAKEFLRLSPRSRNYFFSYQCDKGERPTASDLEGIAVLFFDNYKPTVPLHSLPRAVVCPLNESQDITGVCEKCRRCFSR